VARRAWAWSSTRSASVAHAPACGNPVTRIIFVRQEPDLPLLTYRCLERINRSRLDVTLRLHRRNSFAPKLTIQRQPAH
jgi:hypothetical protein